MSRFRGYLAAVGASLLFIGFGLSACGSAESSGTEADESALLGEHSEALFFAKSGACLNYEAENVGRTGGQAATGGWNLRAAGDNINVDQAFMAGEYTFSIVAWGGKGTGTAKPSFRLKLNDFVIDGGSGVIVTNTALTSGWSEYTVKYTVNTPGTKRVKLELLNPGEGRYIIFDGFSVCPPSDTVRGLRCDQHSDCDTGNVCAVRGTAFDGLGVGCMETPVCATNDTVTGVICGAICKTPASSQSACPSGQTCKDVAIGEYLNVPGWKYCQVNGVW